MYSSSEVAKVLRQITLYLQENPLVLAKEGVFRLSGNQTAAKKIVNNILQNKSFKKRQFFARMNNFPIHDYVSAMKLVLNESNLLNPEDLQVQFLRENLETSEPEQGAQILQEYINDLIKSHDNNERNVGEIFYRYFQIITLASTFAEKNKMSPDNLGKILGPSIEKLINNDPQKVPILIFKLNDVCTLMLQDHFFANEFEKKDASKKTNSMPELQTISVELSNLNKMIANDVRAADEPRKAALIVEMKKSDKQDEEKKVMRNKKRLGL
ncbi:MAG: hypothetical protein HYX61_05725 [Gammaproteobacteria bacterium]|jgi:hypothetical protein|nr:hypothetical protein [Gammaproteobacteria bacterium]